MLDKEEDNDLDVIDKKIRVYWNIDKIDKKDGK
jgi:hypothetical protein